MTQDRPLRNLPYSSRIDDGLALDLHVPSGRDLVGAPSHVVDDNLAKVGNTLFRLLEVVDSSLFALERLRKQRIGYFNIFSEELVHAVTFRYLPAST